MNDGAIFDKVEVKFNLSEGEPEGVYFKVSKDANHLIEEFMLANRKVAEFIGKQKKTLFIEFMMNLMKINCLPCKLISKFGYKIDF
jgi:ribonuclease R